MKQTTTVCDQCKCHIVQEELDWFTINVPEQSNNSSILGMAVGISVMPFSLQTRFKRKSFNDLAFCNVECFKKFLDCALISKE